MPRQLAAAFDLIKPCGAASSHGYIDYMEIKLYVDADSYIKLYIYCIDLQLLQSFLCTTYCIGMIVPLFYPLHSSPPSAARSSRPPARAARRPGGPRGGATSEPGADDSDD